MWRNMTRRVGRVAFAALAVVIAGSVAGTAVAAASPAPQPNYVSGFGVRAASCASGCPTPLFWIEARSLAGGVDPTGWMGVDIPGLASWSGHVVCLNVIGNQATIVGQMDTASGTDVAVGGYFMTVVWDNGVSPDKMSLIDWGTSVSDAFGSYSVAQVCAEPTLILGSPLPQFGVSGIIHVN